MSSTELFGFKEDGSCISIGDIRNSWRGAMAVWIIIEERYLPPYEPEWAKGYELSYQPTRTIRAFNTPEKEQPIYQIWDLFKTDKISKIDKIVLGSTFDKVIVESKNYKELLNAFDNFKGETNLKDQANIIRKEGSDLQAIAWCQNTVSDPWCEDYNINTGEDHWELFEDMKETSQVK